MGGVNPSLLVMKVTPAFETAAAVAVQFSTNKVFYKYVVGYTVVNVPRFCRRRRRRQYYYRTPVVHTCKKKRECQAAEEEDKERYPRLLLRAAKNRVLLLLCVRSYD